MLFDNHQIFLWFLRKWPRIALSSSEVKYMALVTKIGDTKLLIQLLNTMIKSNENEHATICCDGQGNTALSEMPRLPTFKTCRHKD